MLVPKGFSFAVAQAGFKREGRYDLTVVISDGPAASAGVFTTNLFKAAPVLVAMQAVAASPEARAVVVNSGQANACTGEPGLADCRESLELVGAALGIAPGAILPMSTGVIGPRLKLDRWRAAMEPLAASLGQAGPMDSAKAIMTTDTFPKLAWARVEGTSAVVMGMCKGAGMICPDMATMLGIVLTDAAVDGETWRQMLAQAVDESFNRVTVDGDTSTNDCVFGLAGGASGVRVADEETAQALYDAVVEVCQSLAYMVVQDAEGGTKVMRITVGGAVDDAQAELAVRAVGHSPLVKTALYGKDANWGRIAAALGRSGAEFDPAAVTIAIGGVVIFEHGRPVDLDIDALMAPVLRRQDVDIDVTLGDGPGGAVLLASDLTHEYVSINADYRS
jgi:glutamate N-acetyltransferase/amino-acid N-acetyltransferase